VSKSVLIIEDNLDIRDALVLMLSQLGCVCRVASTRDEALKQLEADRFDMILTDFVMPGIGLLAFRQEVKRLRPNTPIVVFSSFDSIEDDMRALGFGFFRKPFDEETLKKVCSDV